MSSLDISFKEYWLLYLIECKERTTKDPKRDLSQSPVQDLKMGKKLLKNIFLVAQLFIIFFAILNKKDT